MANTQRPQQRLNLIKALLIVTCYTTLSGCADNKAFAADRAKIDLSNPPQGVFIDEWMLMEMGTGERVGYTHTEISRSGDTIDTQVLTSFSLGRVGAPIDIVMHQSSTETIDGKVLSFSNQMDASMQKLEMYGQVKNNKAYITSKQFGIPTKKEYDYPKGALMTWGMVLRQDQMGYKDGTEYTIFVYEPMTAANTAMEVKVAVGKKEEIKLDDKAVTGIRLTQTMNLPQMPGGVTSTSWVDDRGIVLKTEMPMMGMVFNMIRSTKDEALKEFDPPEFFAPTTIAVDQDIDRANTKRIDYVLKLRDKQFKMPPLPTTDLQTPKAINDSTVEVTVKRTNHAALKDLPVTKYGREFKEYLTPNPIINCEDPEVKKMAETAANGATKPYEIADNLRKYVADVIADKNLNIGFATASEVCRNKTGDCSEHAVLLAALGRARGIPTQVAVGLVYVPVFGGKQRVFGFHMWTQFRIGDKWVDFDAAMNESDCNPTHIAFATNSLTNAGLGQIVFPLINVIGNLDLTVKSTDPPTKTEAKPAA